MGTRRWWRWTVAGALAATVACFPGAEEGALDFQRGEFAQFEDCNALQSELQRRALREAESWSYLAVTGGVFTPPGHAASEPGDVSPTNNQERGVDEADFFKWDDGAVYALHGKELVIADTSGVLSTTPLEGTPYEMHVDGGRVLVMARGVRSEVKEHFAEAPDRDTSMPVTRATVLDVADRAAPKVVRELLLEGEVIGTRRIGDAVHIATRAMLGGPAQDLEPDGEEHWLTRRRQVIESAGVDQWIPSYYDKTHGTVHRASCQATYVSAAASGDGAMTVYSLSLQDAANDKLASTTIIGDGAELYASTRSIVIALPGEEAVGESFQGDGPEPGAGQVTWVHRFALDQRGPFYTASGRVPGWILNQFSLSEHNGYIRVATMTGVRGHNNAASHVFVLREGAKEHFLADKEGKPDFLRTVGSVRDIAVGEDLYAARFQGKLGYLVTFRETDPLWTIDLSDPENPQVLGELMVPGYSTYIHPIEGEKLIAVGRSALNNGGVKLSLFDVSDLHHPSVVEEEIIGSGTAVSEAIEEHKAFNWMPEHRLLALPIRTPRASGLNLYEVSHSRGFIYRGRISHNDLSDAQWVTVRRSLTVDGAIWSHSSAGITLTDADSLETVLAIDLPDAELAE